MTATIDTARLRLRRHRADDYAACRTLWGDLAVVRHIGGTPQDAQTVWFRLLRYAGSWSLLGYGNWVVEDRATGAFLGEAGLLRAERGLPELDGRPEAGWVLLPSAWGKGIASEAMAAAMHWADTHLDAPSCRCIIDPDNDGSIRVATKLGFTPMTDTQLAGKPIRVFDRPRQKAG